VGSHRRDRPRGREKLQRLRGKVRSTPIYRRLSSKEVYELFGGEPARGSGYAVWGVVITETPGESMSKVTSVFSKDDNKKGWRPVCRERQLEGRHELCEQGKEGLILPWERAQVNGRNKGPNCVALGKPRRGKGGDAKNLLRENPLVKSKLTGREEQIEC